MNCLVKVCVSPLLLATTNCVKRESRAGVRLSLYYNHHRPLANYAAAPLVGQIVHRFNKVSADNNNDDIHLTIDTGEIRRTVKSRLGGRYREGHTCITTDCPSCAKRRASDAADGGIGSSKPVVGDLGELQINLKTGYSFCCNCFLQGPWPRLHSYLTAVQRCDTKSLSAAAENKINHGQPDIDDFLTPYTSSSRAEADEMRLVWDSAQPVRSLPEETLLPFLRNLHLQAVKLRTLDRIGARINLQKHQLILPCKCNNELGYNSLRIISPNHNPNWSEEDADSQQQQPLVIEKSIPAIHPWLLGYHLINKSKETEVILTSSAADALIALQSLSIPVLCLPAGISQLPLVSLALLERFAKITLWLGHGLSGDESARLFAKKLDEKRCHLIRSTEETPSAHQCHLKGIDMTTVYRSAVPMLHKAVTTFSSLRSDVLAEVMDSRKAAGVRWRRFPVLTELLKGHRRGELTVFTGPTGAGKTTFLSEYSLDLCSQNVRTLWGSFELRNVRLAKLMLQQLSGKPLDKTVDSFDQAAQLLEKLPMFFLDFHGQQNIVDVIDAMSYSVYVHDIGHILVDNLQFMMGQTGGGSSLDRFYLQDNIIGQLRHFATVRNVHITLVIHPRKEADELSASSIFGGAKASQEADNILILQEGKRSSPGADIASSVRRKYLQVAKNRYAGDLGVMPLEFHKESLSFSSSATIQGLINKSK